jgi:hypothetical protein
MRLVTWARSSGIVKVTMRRVMTRSAMKTIEILNPLADAAFRATGPPGSVLRQ